MPRDTELVGGRTGAPGQGVRAPTLCLHRLRGAPPAASVGRGLIRQGRGLKPFSRKPWARKVELGSDPLSPDLFQHYSPFSPSLPSRHRLPSPEPHLHSLTAGTHPSPFPSGTPGPSEPAPRHTAGFGGKGWTLDTDRPEFESGFDAYQLCDSDQILNLSEPQFPHL